MIAALLSAMEGLGREAGRREGGGREKEREREREISLLHYKVNTPTYTKDQ